MCTRKDNRDIEAVTIATGAAYPSEGFLAPRLVREGGTALGMPAAAAERAVLRAGRCTGSMPT
jgi:hypothetical protein